MKTIYYACILLIVIVSGCKKEKNKSGEFTVLTYNVAGLPAVLSSSKPELYTSEISKLLNEYSVVHAQEDFCYHDSLLLFNTHPYKTEAVGCSQQSDGLSTFSMYPISNLQRIGWTDCIDADCLTRKGFSYTQLDFGNGTVIDFYNMHAQAQSDAVALEKRRKNIAQLCAYINEHSAGKPIILMGDFNSRYTRGGDTIRAVLDLGFKDTWVEVIRNGVLPTNASSSLTDCGTVRTNPNCETVDKIFYRSSDKVQITPLDYRLDDPRFYYNNNDTLPLSDHWPMFAKFSYKVIE
jgi:endonuclease/exonuclease/phosphatase family metal-dependent hydrolase